MDPLAVLAAIYKGQQEAANFTSAKKLQRAWSKKGPPVESLKAIQDWLRSKDTYTTHRVARVKYKRNPIIAPFIDAQWQGDLADMVNLAPQNNRVKYWLVLIDVVSKFVWVEPMKSKGGPATVEAFHRVWAKTHRRPEKLQTDDGTEFLYTGTQAMLKRMKIGFFTVKSDVKAAVVERVIRTLKEKVWRYMYEHNTKRYVDVLQDLVEAYNNTYHESIKMAPAEVSQENEGQVLHNLYGYLWNRKPMERGRSVRPKFHRGDLVRLSHVKRAFKKGYMGKWTEEVFRVKEVVLSWPKTTYRVEAWDGEPIEGTFYEEELQKVHKDVASGYWKVERVVRVRTRGRQKEYLVKWLGYPDTMNSWVKEKDMKRV